MQYTKLHASTARQNSVNMTRMVLVSIVTFASFLISVYEAEPIDVAGVKADDLDVNAFSKTINHIVDGVSGLDYLQNIYNELEYRRTELNGPSLVKELAQILNGKFKDRIQVVERIRDTIEQQYEFFTELPEDDICCQLNKYSLKEVARYSTKVDLNKLCVHTAPSSSEHVKYPTKKVLEVMIDRYNAIPHLKWLYFASESGLMVTYPATNFDPTCSTYDHRVRPFYVEAATPRQKAVVILVDESKSMSSSYSHVAVQAAKTIIETLNPRDTVGVITFSTVTRTPPGEEDDCFSEKLAEATPENKAYLKTWLNEYMSEGGTKYMPAIRKAFEMFANSASASERDKVILFLTDGEPEEKEEDILRTIHYYNGQMNNSVIIMTYLVGDGYDPSAVGILRNMAFQKGFNASNGAVTKGTFTLVHNAERLRTEMASYYNFFNRRHRSSEPVITIPYVDAFSKDLITSILLPAYYKNQFLGIVGTDINMKELIEDVMYFKKGETSYAFMIDKGGRLMTHPLLPTPHKVEEPPIFLFAGDIEFRAASRGVIRSMMRGESGNASFSSNHVYARGTSAEGVNSFKVYSHYFWHFVPNSSCSVCLVLSRNDMVNELMKTNYLKSKFLYHAEVSKKPWSNQCEYFDHVARKDAAAVKFSPIAFLHPLEYLFEPETEEDVEKITEYIKGSGTSKDLRTGVREAVAAAAQVETVWMKTPRLPNDKQSVVWQKLCTFEGVLIMYPGITLPKMYDCTERSWFLRTLGNRGQRVFAAPRADEWGTRNVVTITNTIFHGKKSTRYARYDRIAGVLATDVTLEYLYKKMIESNKACTLSKFRCFLLDSSGFVVMHENLAAHDSQQAYMQPVHIIKMLPWIANQLIGSKILKRKGCIDYKRIRIYNTWRVSLYQRFRQADSNGEVLILLDRVPDSNLFLGIHTVDIPAYNQCRCLDGISECAKTDKDACECPCYEKAHSYYHYCENRYNPSSDSLPTCSPHLATMAMGGEVPGGPDRNMNRCFDYKCAKQTKRSDCRLLTGCKWCENKNGTPSACRHYNETCQFVVDDPDSPASPLILGLSIGSAGFVLLVIVITVSTVCVVKRRRARAESPRPRPRLPSIQDLTAQSSRSLRSLSISSSSDTISTDQPSLYTSNINHLGGESTILEEPPLVNPKTYLPQYSNTDKSIHKMSGLSSLQRGFDNPALDWPSHDKFSCACNTNQEPDMYAGSEDSCESHYQPIGEM